MACVKDDTSVSEERRMKERIEKRKKEIESKMNCFDIICDIEGYFQIGELANSLPMAIMRLLFEKFGRTTWRRSSLF